MTVFIELCGSGDMSSSIKNSPKSQLLCHTVNYFLESRGSSKRWVMNAASAPVVTIFDDTYRE